MIFFNVDRLIDKILNYFKKCFEKSIKLNISTPYHVSCFWRLLKARLTTNVEILRVFCQIHTTVHFSTSLYHINNVENISWKFWNSVNFSFSLLHESTSHRFINTYFNYSHFSYLTSCIIFIVQTIYDWSHSVFLYIINRFLKNTLYYKE